MQSPSHRISVNTGDVLFRESDIGDCAFFIERGRIEISIERGGFKTVLGMRGSGEVVGEMAVIDAKPRTATATAAEPSELVIVTREQLQSRIDRTDPVLRICLNMILERFRETLCDLNGVKHMVIRAVSAECAQRSANPDFQVALREIETEHEIERALERDELELFFQPIVSLDDDRIRGFEGLVRWRHPQRGLLPAGAFIPIAEASGLILPLGRWVLKHACEAALRLNQVCAERSDRAPIFVTVNLSGRDFADAAFVPRVRETLERSGVPPHLLHLEITETAIMAQPELAIAAIDELKSLGLTIIIDDFGTGYSSLSYLHRFPIDVVKIDRSFVQSAPLSQRDARIAQAIVALAKQLNMAVVAEGIETEQQRAVFREFCCDYAQGFYYAKAVAEASARQMLVTGRFDLPATHAAAESG